MSDRDPGLPEDPDHPSSHEPDGPRPPVAPPDRPGGSHLIVRTDGGRPGDHGYPEVPVLDWCYLWPLSLGRAAPGARRVRWGGQTLPQPTIFGGPGALWSTEASSHLVPEWAPPAGRQSGISRMGVHRSGGVSSGTVVLVPRARLLQVAEYADASVASTGNGHHRPSAGYSEWSLALVGGPTGVAFGVRIDSFEDHAVRPAAIRRFAEAVDADWTVAVHRFAGDARAPECDRLTVATGDGCEVYHWDHGTVRLVDPPQVETRLDAADVRTLHDVAAYLAVRREVGTPWYLGDAG